MQSTDKIDRVAREYIALQDVYREWGQQGLACHSDALASLKKLITDCEEKEMERPSRAALASLRKRVADFQKRKPQSSFTPFDSYWNDLTVEVARVRAEEHYEGLRRAFEELPKDDLRRDYRNLYLLFFLHPVRHELWFYQYPHYPGGYARGVKRGICHGKHYNLMTARRYYSDPPTRQASLSACRALVLKSLLLHPTTEDWWQAGGKAPEMTVECPCHEVMPPVACRAFARNWAASAAPKNLFDGWFARYAQCAINEGPIFRLKDGKPHRECLDAIKVVLSEAQRQGGGEKTSCTQDALRATLREFYDVELIRES